MAAGEQPQFDKVDQQSHGQFRTTHWSVVMAAGGGASPASAKALETLCANYWYPLYAYARRRLATVDEAQDMTQEFFAFLLEKNPLSRADPARGRFRSFLLASFKHFLSHERDRARALKRGGGRRLQALDFDQGERRFIHEPADLETPEKIFERRWALTVLDKAMARLRGDYVEAGKEELFEGIKATLTGDGPAPYSLIAEKLGMTEAAIKVAVHRLRRRYQEILHDEIAQTVHEPEEIDDELKHLFQAVRRQ
jgi:RNA polymerase sigma-70 factor (ECF subfamily)